MGRSWSLKFEFESGKDKNPFSHSNSKLQLIPSPLHLYTFADACAHCSSDLLRGLGFASADTYGFGFAESTLRFASLIFGASHGLKKTPQPFAPTAFFAAKNL